MLMKYLLLLHFTIACVYIILDIYIPLAGTRYNLLLFTMFIIFLLFIYFKYLQGMFFFKDTLRVCALLTE